MQAAGIDLLFYGDSLTELWRGTAWGFHSRLGPGIPAVFSRYFGQYDSVIAGAGGRQGCSKYMHQRVTICKSWLASTLSLQLRLELPCAVWTISLHSSCHVHMPHAAASACWWH